MPIFDLEEDVVVMGIDPGTDTYGISIGVVGKDGNKRIIHVETVSGHMLSRSDPRYYWVRQLHSPKAARLQALVDFTMEVIAIYGPTRLYYETPFLRRRFPGAFGPLTECMSAIQQALSVQHPHIPFGKVAPQEAKAAVGVTGKGSQKDSVAAGVQRRKDLIMEVDTNPIDEHGWDSISVMLGGLDKTDL